MTIDTAILFTICARLERRAQLLAGDPSNRAYHVRVFEQELIPDLHAALAAFKPTIPSPPDLPAVVAPALVVG